MASIKNRIFIDLTGDSPPRNAASKGPNIMETGGTNAQGSSSTPKLLQRMSSSQDAVPKRKSNGLEQSSEAPRRKKRRDDATREQATEGPSAAPGSLAARLGLIVHGLEDPASSEDDTPRKPQSSDPEKSRKTNKSRSTRRARRAEAARKASNNEESKEKGSKQESLQFVSDLVPTVVDSTILASFAPPSLLAPAATIQTSKSDTVTLVLPSHVRLAEDDPEEQAPEPIPNAEHKDSDESEIEWLDDIVDNTQGVGRYFAKQPSTSYQNCRLCGERGHREKDCTRVMCLTCGAMDEHETRSCPIPLTCFNCGGRGHINANCLAPRQRRGCDRCGSAVHQTNNCPTLWRIYTYNSGHIRDAILKEREAARGKPFLEGGELYLGNDTWCYCCGEEGHWGDDCTERWKPIKEPTIFSQTALMTGPFASDHHDDRRSSRDRRQRGWERPMQPGRDGRERQKQRNQTLIHEADDDDDESWFDTQHRRALGDSRRGRRDKERSNEKNVIIARDIDRFRERYPEFDRGGHDTLTARSSQQNGSVSKSVYPSRPKGETSRREREERDSAEARGHGGRRGKERDGDKHRDDGRRSKLEDSDRGPHYRGGYGR